MSRSFWSQPLVTVTALVWTATLTATACSDSGSADFGRDGSGGSSAGGNGGTAASGGTGGTVATGGSGGNGAGGGSAGTAGAPPDAPAPCAPPLDPTAAAVCVQLAPERVTPVSLDPDLDGQGVLVVEVFDEPNPELPDGGSVTPLATRTFGNSGDLLDITGALPELRFDDLPNTVYLRATFFDAEPTGPFPRPGVWLGGFDLNQGLRDDAPLVAVNLVQGVGRAVTLDLRALRQLDVRVSVDPAAAPVDDAQGPAQFVVLSSRSLDPSQAIFGAGASPCADVSGGQVATIQGIVIGEGPYFLFSSLDDFGLGRDTSPGALITALLSDAGTPTISVANRFALPPGAYRHTVAVQFASVFPLDDGGVPASFSCRPRDGGTDLDGGSGDASADGSPDAGDAAQDAPAEAADGSADVGAG